MSDQTMTVGQTFDLVDLSLLHGGEPGGELATLTVRLTYRDTDPDTGELVVMADCVDDVFGREHDYLRFADIRRAQD